MPWSPPSPNPVIDLHARMLYDMGAKLNDVVLLILGYRSAIWSVHFFANVGSPGARVGGRYKLQQRAPVSHSSRLPSARRDPSMMSGWPGARHLVHRRCGQPRARPPHRRGLTGRWPGVRVEM
jgi:hypothetical protein